MRQLMPLILIFALVLSLCTCSKTPPLPAVPESAAVSSAEEPKDIAPVEESPPSNMIPGEELFPEAFRTSVSSILLRSEINETPISIWDDSQRIAAVLNLLSSASYTPVSEDELHSTLVRLELDTGEASDPQWLNEGRHTLRLCYDVIEWNGTQYRADSPIGDAVWEALHPHRTAADLFPSELWTDVTKLHLFTEPEADLITEYSSPEAVSAVLDWLNSAEYTLAEDMPMGGSSLELLAGDKSYFIGISGDCIGFDGVLYRADSKGGDLLALLDSFEGAFIVVCR